MEKRTDILKICGQELLDKAKEYATCCDEARQCSECGKDIGVEETMRQYVEWIHSPWNGFFESYEYDPDYVEVTCNECVKKLAEKDKKEEKKLKDSTVDAFTINRGKYDMRSEYSLLYLDGKYTIKAFAQDQNYEEPASRSWFEIELITKNKEKAQEAFDKLKDVKQSEKYPEYNPGLSWSKEKFIWGFMPNKNGKLVMTYGK